MELTGGGVGQILQAESLGLGNLLFTDSENAMLPPMFDGSLQLFLAPMEGITDWVMRDTLTQLGGIDFCVTEFLRVTKTLHPKRVFVRHCPELLTESKTRAGTPVFLQLLGGEALPMAENALRAAELGAAGIDLNFGCPAKTVNRHDGGAVLLKSPQRLHDIAKAVRGVTPLGTPVSAKIRLGYEDDSLCLENALALQEAGVQWLTVHCRTKAQGYRPPAHWHWIPLIKEKLNIPVVANGDINSLETFEACRSTTGAQLFMIGRGSLSNPSLFTRIKGAAQTANDPAKESRLESTKDLAKESSIESNIELVKESPNEWKDLLRQILPFFEACTLHINDHFATARTKQWLKHLSQRYPEAREIFEKTKAFMQPVEYRTALEKLVSQDGCDRI